MNFIDGMALFSIFAVSTPAPEPAIQSWTCTAREQVDRQISGMLQMIVNPDGTRRELSFYVNWSKQPGHVAEQQISWIFIPLGAEQLWKPDNIGISVATSQTDERGSVLFHPSAAAQIWSPAQGVVRSLRPTFPATWVDIQDRHLVARLWSDWPRTVELRDRSGTALGSQVILLPGPEGSQALFGRLRTELDRLAASKESSCQANREPDEWEQLQEVI